MTGAAHLNLRDKAVRSPRSAGKKRNGFTRPMLASIPVFLFLMLLPSLQFRKAATRLVTQTEIPKPEPLGDDAFQREIMGMTPLFNGTKNDPIHAGGHYTKVESRIEVMRHAKNKSSDAIGDHSTKTKLRVAVIYNGELNQMNKGGIEEVINEMDVYISTYEEYEDYAIQLTKNRSRVLLFSRDEVPCLPIPIYQWWHMNQVLSHYRTELESYDLIMKLRSDLFFHKPFRSSKLTHTPQGCFQMNSDHSFYADTKTFLKVLDGFYDDIYNKYYDRGAKYFPINWHNMKETIKNVFDNYKMSPVRNLSRYRQHRRDITMNLHFLVYPKAIYNKSITILLKNIRNLQGEPDLSHGFSNRDRGCIPFSAEKYFFLNVVNKAPICPNKLPAIGIQGNHRDRQRVNRTIPCSPKMISCARKKKGFS